MITLNERASVSPPLYSPGLKAKNNQPTNREEIGREDEKARATKDPSSTGWQLEMWEVM